MAFNPSAIDWAALEAFAAEQQRLESLGASTLTPAQRAAIATLIPPRAPTPTDAATGATLDDTINYIGHLNQYLQKHHPNTSLQFAEEGINTPKPGGRGFDLVWRCRCTIPDPETGANVSFPLGRDGQVTFARKQQARQYAAFAACAHLDAHGATPLPAGARPSPPAAAAVAAPAAAAAAYAPSVPASRAPVPDVPAPHAPSPPAISQKDARDAEARALALARELRLPPPTYKVGQAEDGSWRARCCFEHPVFPDGLGAVSGASSRAGAHKQAADHVVGWMEAEKVKRQLQMKPYMV